ncbi:hypothetical protein NLG97_g10433 [Lecanicillium saksenae]|uniref:Uncharacterized protein n=1 Tax=Lecanicillium saksenae TaxID=468837 RepID=A0ACC1QFX6_9HYPO|nr:hypothetical protein NLG97_g10433 [Lecanicillium saksenae]
MPAYNSVFNSEPNPRLIGNFPLLALRTKVRGPAYTLPLPNPPLPASESPDPDSESYDILDVHAGPLRVNVAGVVAFFGMLSLALLAATSFRWWGAKEQVQSPTFFLPLVR